MSYLPEGTISASALAGADSKKETACATKSRFPKTSRQKKEPTPAPICANIWLRSGGRRRRYPRSGRSSHRRHRGTAEAARRKVGSTDQRKDAPAGCEPSASAAGGSSAIGRQKRRTACNRSAKCDTPYTMSKSTRKKSSPLTDPLRKAINESGLPLLRLSQETGIARASLIRFARGDQSIRLDIADRLASYFGLTLHGGS